MSASAVPTRKPKPRRPRAADWSERQFQHWFKEHLELKGGEPLLLLKIENEFESVVDIVALDSEARLVIIEVKSERTTRAAVGQALEYLSTYDGVTLEELASDCVWGSVDTLVRKFNDRFPQIRPLRSLCPARRVYVAAPEFTPNSDICVRYLNDVLRDRKVHVGLLKVERDPDRREEFLPPQEIEPRRLVVARQLERFALSVGDTLYFRLDDALPPLFWRIGKRDSKGVLELESKAKPKELLVEKYSRRIQVTADAEPVDVDVSGTGSAYRHDLCTARLLGVIGSGTTRHAVLAKFERQEPKGFEVLAYPQFAKQWRPIDKSSAPGWRDRVQWNARMRLAKEPKKHASAERPFDEAVFRAAVWLDVRKNADYGSDNTSSVVERVWRKLYGETKVSEQLLDSLENIVDDEWDLWFEEDEE